MHSHNLSLAGALASILLLAPTSHGQCRQDSIFGMAPANDDQFGAAIAIDDDLAVIGAPGADTGKGRILITQRSTELRWNSVVEVASTALPFQTGFGQSLAMDDGVIVAGVPDTTGLLWGTVQVIENLSGTWTNMGAVFHSTLDSFDEFGSAVALVGDNLFVGAPEAEFPSTGDRTGAVYVFERDPMSAIGWTEIADILPPTPSAGMKFGESLDVDGDNLVIGAPKDLNSSGGFQIGAAYLFENQSGSWVHQQTVIGNGTLDEEFGAAVALSNDRLLVGAPGAQDAQSTMTGAGYTFDRNASGVWLLNAQLIETTATPQHRAGASVDLVDDLAIVGAPHSGVSPGNAYVYVNTNGIWDQIRNHQYSNAHAGDRFGTAVALSGREVTGDLALVGGTGILGTAGAIGGVEYRGTTLEGCPTQIPAFNGGTHTLSITAGAQNAGKAYWVFGSATGTSPGLDFGPGGVLPLVVDPYFNLTLNRWFAALFNNSFVGTLDAAGQATATLTINPDPGLQGVTLFHAYALSSSIGSTVEFTSHATCLRL